MADPWAEVEEAVRAGDADRVVSLCLPLSEDARSRLAPAAVALVADVDQGWESAPQRAAQTAVLCLGPPPSDWSVVRHPAYERLEEIVRARPRAWRDAWAQGPDYAHPPPGWRALRALVRAGDCAKPGGERYAWRFLYAMQCLAGGVFCEPGSVTEALRADPSLLDEDVWLAFRVAAANGWLFEALQRAVVELAAEGSLPRDRLVDETLAAIVREEDAGNVRRLFAFHDRMVRPTPAELSARRSRYLRWLESDRDALVGFALGNVARLDRARPVDAHELLDRLAPLVALRSKAHAKRAVVLAGRVADRSPAFAAAALGIVADALAHEAVEVQTAAVEALERHAGAVDRGRIAEAAELADPGLRARLRALAAGAAASGPAPAPPRRSAADGAAPPAVAVPPASVVDPDRVPRLLPSRALTPIEDVEELLDLAGVLLEGLDDPDEAERFTDGVSRLCGEPVAKGRRTALLRRARGHGNPIATLVRAWLGWKEEHPPTIGWTGPTAALGRRLTPLAVRLVEGRSDVLLSAATHRGGFVDPSVLAARLERARTVEDHDLAQALLRVPAVGATAGLERIAAAGGEPAAMAAAVLARERGAPPSGSELPASWDAVAVLADPPGVALEVDPPGDAWYGYSRAAADDRCPARLLAGFEAPAALAWGEVPLVQRWLATAWPGRRDLYFGTVLRLTPAAPRGTRDLHSWQRRAAAAFTVLHDPDEPLGPWALQLVALGLLAPGDLRLAAADVVARAIATRRLVPAALGRALASAVAHPVAGPNRLGPVLDPVASLGPLHALEVQQTLEATFAGLGDHRPPLVTTIDLLRRLAQDADAQVEDAAARGWLEALPARSKSGLLARAALDVAGDGAARSVDAAAAAAGAESERAARWGDG